MKTLILFIIQSQKVHSVTLILAYYNHDRKYIVWNLYIRKSQKAKRIGIVMTYNNSSMHLVVMNSEGLASNWETSYDTPVMVALKKEAC
jgi:hypothetical protein